MQGTVALRGITFQACHGATAAERRTPRRFEVDVALRLDLGRPAASDRLSDAIDYQELSTMIVSLSTQKTYRLLEGLAGVLVDAIANRWPLAEVNLEVRKLHPPCPGDPSFSAVSLCRPGRLPKTQT
jgi:dihydroneopterin aldolase